MDSRVRIITFQLACLLLMALKPAQTQAAGLRCAKDQGICEFENRSLHLGSRVGIFNPQGDLVAYGQVSRLNGETRVVRLKEVFGAITRDDVARPLGKATLDSFRKFQRKPELVWQAAIGMAAVTVGAGVWGPMISGFREQSLAHDFAWTVDATFVNAGGSVNHRAGSDLPDGSFSQNTLGVGAGIAYNVNQNRDLSLRGSATLGGAYTMAEVSGPSNEPSDYVSGFDSGFGVYAKFDLAAYYRWSDWRLGLVPATMFIQSQRIDSISLAVAVDF